MRKRPKNLNTRSNIACFLGFIFFSILVASVFAEVQTPYYWQEIKIIENDLALGASKQKDINDLHDAWRKKGLSEKNQWDGASQDDIQYAKTLAAQRDLAYNRAIHAVLIAYHFAPTDSFGKPELPKGRIITPDPSFGRIAHWMPVSGDRVTRLVQDAHQRIQPVTPKNDDYALTATDGVSVLYPDAFTKGPGGLAMFIFHEREHFKQYVRPGKGDVMARGEREFDAWTETEKNFEAFGIKEPMRKTLSDYVTGKVKESRAEAQKERFRRKWTFGIASSPAGKDILPSPKATYDETERQFDDLGKIVGEEILRVRQEADRIDQEKIAAFLREEELARRRKAEARKRAEELARQREAEAQREEPEEGRMLLNDHQDRAIEEIKRCGAQPQSDGALRGFYVGYNQYYQSYNIDKYSADLDSLKVMLYLAGSCAVATPGRSGFLGLFKRNDITFRPCNDAMDIINRNWNRDFVEHLQSSFPGSSQEPCIYVIYHKLETPISKDDFDDLAISAARYRDKRYAEADAAADAARRYREQNSVPINNQHSGNNTSRNNSGSRCGGPYGNCGSFGGRTPHLP